MNVDSTEFCREFGQTAGCGHGVDVMAGVQAYLMAVVVHTGFLSILYSMAALEICLRCYTDVHLAQYCQFWLKRGLSPSLPDSSH